MSQKATRKSQNPTPTPEEKEKRQADSPLKEMKKKIAANAEKEKQSTAEKDKPTEKADKPVEKNDKQNKSTEKSEKSDKADKSIDKSDKTADKTTKIDKAEKNEKVEKPAEKKPEKIAEKKQEKSDKNDKKTDKPVEKAEQADKKEDSKADKNAKDKAKSVNGHNGAQPTNGANDGTVSDSSDDDLVIEEDDTFPELAYDESDTDAFETDASRSFTRRSQSKESKVLKLNDTPTSDRILRSADSPKPDAKKIEAQKKAQESTTNDDSKEQEEKSDGKKAQESNAAKDEKLGMDVVIEIDSTEEEPRKCRARVSPYSRAKHDVTTSSVQANYTGNNTTMEMDITETSMDNSNADDSGYLRSLRNIRGRASYKLLADLPPMPRTPRPSINILSESRPLGAVVGRKRKPAAEHIELATEVTDDLFDLHAQGKRMRLFDKFSLPFMRTAVSRRAAEIVGINTDLPLTAPVASTSTFDPEIIKASQPICNPQEPIATPLATADRDGKKCIIM